jgi:hypothetical protein
MYILFALACGVAEKDADDNTTSTIEDINVNLTEDEACEGFDGTPIPGGTSFFVGAYEINGTDVTGEERWVILSNDAWEETEDGGDCEVVWTMIGATQDPQNCGACDFGIAASGTVNRDRSTCPSDLYAGEENIQVSYSILRSESEDSTWYFSGSGNQFGSGSWTDSTADFVTSGECVFF